MPFFEPRRAEPAQCRVDADPVIEGLYVLEQGERRLLVAVVGAGHGSGDPGGLGAFSGESASRGPWRRLGPKIFAYGPWKEWKRRRWW